MCAESTSARTRGLENYLKGGTFEDRVAEAYRLLGYRVEHGRLFSGRQVDMFMELTLGDLQIRRAVECKAGEVTADDLDRFLLKLELVKREYSDVRGTLVAGLGFTDGVRSHAMQIGLQLTLYRDLSAQILDGPTYAQSLIREIESNQRYRPSLFVEPAIAHDSTAIGESAFEFLNQWLLDAQWNQLTLLGDVGTGKSFLCRMLARRLASEYLERPTEAPLPILIDLRNADREFSLEGLVLTHFANHGLSRATFDVFDFLLSEGRIVLILDGFDEMAAKVTPLVTTRNFHELARCVKQRAKVLLTCRTHYFKSRTEEEEVVLGSTSQVSEVARDLYWDLISRSGFRIAYLKPFSINQVEAYVHNACPGRETQVLDKIRRIYNLAELSQRPLLLEMIVKSIDKFTTSEVDSAQLYEIFTNAWIHRDLWRDVMRPEEKLRFLTALARTLWIQERTKIDYRELEQFVGIELASLITDPRTLVELDAEIRTASFLIRDQLGQYGFAHASYQEYFLAKDLATHLNASDVEKLAIRRLTNEVVDFLTCMVSHQKLEQMLTQVLQAEFQPLVSENALVILYSLRRKIAAQKKEESDVWTIDIELPREAKLQGAKLGQVVLEGAKLQDAQLDGADLHECIAAGVDLSGCSLRSAVLTKGDLQGAVLCRVDFANATLTEVNLQNADVDGCDFTGADLSNSLFTVRGARAAVLKDVSVRTAVLSSEAEDALIASGVLIPAHSDSDDSDLISRFFDRAHRYAKLSGALFEAEDIATEVVIRVLSKPNELNRLKNLTSDEVDSFIRSQTWRLTENVRKEEQRRVSPLLFESDDAPFDVEDEDDSFAKDEIPYEELLAARHIKSKVQDPIIEMEMRDLINLVKDALSEDAYELLVEKYVEELSIEEIAKSRRLSKVEVIRQINKARELVLLKLNAK